MTYPLREQIIEQSKDGTLMTPDQRLAWDAAFRRVLAVIDALSHPQTGGSWYRESDIDALQARATAAEAEVARLTAERDALRAQIEDVSAAAVKVADAIDADMLAFNHLGLAFTPRLDAPARHFFSDALRHYANNLTSRD